MTVHTQEPTTVASVNGVALNPAGAALPAGELRQRACSELLRQAAMASGLLAADDLPPDDGALSAAATQAIEDLLEQVLVLPEPCEEECRRHYAAHVQRYASGARVHARHILFAVTPGVDVEALRLRAEACLIDVRSDHLGSGDNGDIGAEQRFARAASTLSNCPSGAEGGELGWLGEADCAPEFARELFAGSSIGVLPRLVHSRFGFHIVAVLERQAAVPRDYAEVRGAVAGALRQSAYATALRRYLGQLAEQASVVGVDLGLGLGDARAA